MLFNTFWILGLAILLAAFSYQYWEAQQTDTQLKEQLNKPTFLKFIWLSFILISIGLVGTSEKIWEMIIWGMFILIGLINLVRTPKQQG